jgi:hypothetical protein
MAKIENFVDALEAYLAKQGKGGNYLANKLTSLFENKTSPLNLKDGPLKDFGDKLKDFNKNLKNLNNFSQKLTDKIKDLNKEIKIKTFTSLDTSIKNLSNKISNISLPSFNNINFPSLSGFKKTLDSLLTRMRDFRDSIKIGVMNTFMNNIKSMNTLTRKINTILNNNSNSKSTRGKNSVVDVNIVGIDSSIKSFLNNLIKKVGTTNNTLVNNTKDKEEGSIIGKIIKGIIGTVALLAGIGFLSKFLDTPMGKAIGNAFGNMKNAFIKMLKPFLEKIIDYSIEGLRVLFTELPKYFLKQTFNFFGLKEILGKENEGIAVLLTKGIYYGVKKFFLKSLNGMSLGLFAKLGSIFKIDKLFSVGGQVGKLEKIGDTLYRLGSNLNAIPKYLKSITRSNVVLRTIFNVMDKAFSALTYLPKLIFNFFSNMGFGIGKITKGISSIAKFGGGSILKLLGTGLKGIAKGIPFIGALISFKDAYDRFKKGDITGGLISVVSGFASFLPPGVGLAVSIGLDLFNAFLDKKTEGGKTSKLAAIGNMLKPLYDSLITGLNWFVNLIGDIFSALNPVNWAKGIWNWFTGEKEKLDENIEKGKKPVEYNPVADTKTTPTQNSTTRWDMPQKVGDARISNNKLVIPSSDDDVVMAKNGGPFDKAFKEMNEKFDTLISVFAQGTQLIANTTIQGSASVAQAVSTSSGKSPIIVGGNDPIADFRLRANKSVG